MIKVYHFETGMHHLGWHKTYCDLANYYKIHHNAEIVHLKSIVSMAGQVLHCPELNFDLSDTDFVIIDTEKDIIKIITWNESNRICTTGVSLTSALEKRNNPNDIILIGHLSSFYFSPKDKKPIVPSSFKFKVKSTTWYPFVCDLSFDEIYEERKNLELIDELFFASSTRREDPFILSKMGICNSNVQWMGSMENYIKQASKYKVGLAISSVSEKCYREIEYMAIGLPCMRLTFIGDHSPPLVPNYHYIEVNREENGIPTETWSCSADRAGGELYVEAYKKRFLEVKDDKDFLDFISTNAREYFKTYCDTPVRIKELLKLLEE